ncbi:hypothetical protein ACB098_09G167800 [Castanea mollissima]
MTEFVYSVAANVIDKIVSLAYQEICSPWGISEDMKKLELTMSTIQAVLLDAEEKQVKNRGLTVWLGQLKDVFHDAEDVLDEFECESLQRKVVETHGSTREKVLESVSYSSFNPLGFSYKMCHKIKGIRKRLEELAKDRALFHLEERSEDQHIVHREREMTHSFVRDSNVIGRVDDKQKIITLLMHPGDNIGNVHTTLAQWVYNDERVAKSFDSKIWVCVSEDFNILKLAKKILKSAGGEISENMSMDEVQTSLRSILKENRFFIVLDDVWNEDHNKWIDLKNLLIGGQGSKILVTTRSHKVAIAMAPGPIQNIKGLSDDDCLSLFLRCAFNEGEHEPYPKLVEIGKQIVKKCSGVPLAVKTLGSLLYSKIEEHFRYNNFDLIQSWMANGLFKKSNKNIEELEDIGEQYIKELLSRSFFQKDVDYGTIFMTFKMHDLLHDLALYVAQDDYCLVENINNTNKFEKSRHISILDHKLGVDARITILHKLNWAKYEEDGLASININESLVETCISRFKHLRLLNLRFSKLETLSSSIGTLKHLRYLNLHGNKQIKKLPNSICDLQNLETLILLDCQELEELPRDIKKMVSLRFFFYNHKANILESFNEGFQRLTALCNFGLADCKSLISLPQGLKHLTALGYLGIRNCEKLNFMEGVDYPTRLRTLYISKLPQSVTLPQWLIQFVSTLQFIYIYNCKNLEELPKWLPNLSSLRKLLIWGCPKLSSLPDDMDRLTALRELEIGFCYELRRNYEREVGKDWAKIAHNPQVKFTPN